MDCVLVLVLASERETLLGRGCGRGRGSVDVAQRVIDRSLVHVSVSKTGRNTNIKSHHQLHQRPSVYNRGVQVHAWGGRVGGRVVMGCDALVRSAVELHAKQGIK